MLKEFIKQTKKLYFPSLNAKVAFMVGVLVKENEWAVRENQELSQFLTSLFANTTTILTKTMFRKMVDTLIRLKRKVSDFQATMLRYIIKAMLLTKENYHFMKVETGYFLSGYMLGLKDFEEFINRVNGKHTDNSFMSEQEKGLRRFITSKKFLYPEEGD